MPTKIEIKAQKLRAANFALGAPIGQETTTAHGGSMQQFEGATIYYHEVMASEAHEVHGNILAKYVTLGQFDKAPNGKRLLKFPLSDEQDSADGFCRKSIFEEGAIFSAFGGVALHGRIYDQYSKEGGESGRLGYPLADAVKVAGGEAVFFQFGCVFTGGLIGNSAFTIFHRLPQLGHPWFLRQQKVPNDPVVEFFDDQANMNRGVAGEFFKAIYKDRLYLQAVGSNDKVSLIFDGDDTQEQPLLEPVHRYFLSLRLDPAATLKNKQLYDIGINLGDNKSRIIAAHSVYNKNSWDDFKFIHATDIHVSRRLDRWRKFFSDRSMDDAVRNFNNFNDNFRELIKYANHLHRQGGLDFIMLTGDLVDYAYEDGEKQQYNNNFVYLDQIIRGLTGKPDQVESEELIVPVLTSLGNHDYRTRSYYPVFRVDITSWPDYDQEQFSAFNLTKDEAKVLMDFILPGGKISSERALKMIRPDRFNEDGNLDYYFKSICRDPSYSVTLGKHKIVMIDGKWDDGAIEDSWDVFQYKLGLKGEATDNFAGGSPDSVGFDANDFSLVKEALQAEGLVIVGVHYPIINPKYSEYSYYLRDTIRSQNNDAYTDQIKRYLYSLDPSSFFYSNPMGYTVDLNKPVHKGWNRGEKGYFHEGSGNDDLLDYGVMRKDSQAFLKICTADRPVDLVLSGHVHKNWECRIRRAGEDKFQIHHDFYTENPTTYYHSYDTNLETGKVYPANDVQVVERIRIHVNVDENASPDPKPVKGDSGVYTITTKPHTPTLNSLADGTAKNVWWAGLRPFFLQTAAVGPCEWLRSPEKQPDFRGCRVISVKNNKISKIGYTTNGEIKQVLSAQPVLEGGGLVTS